MNNKVFFFLLGLSFILFNVSSISFAAPGDVFYFEDFSSYEEGDLPAGWLGGDNLAVISKRNKKVLGRFQTGELNITTKKIKFPNDFNIDISVLLKEDCSFYITIGEIRLRVHDYTFWGANIRKKEMKITRPKTSKNVLITIKKRGKIIRIYWNGAEVGFGRYKNLKFNNITFSKCEFVIDSIKCEEL